MSNAAADTLSEAERRGTELRRRWLPQPPFDENALRLNGVRKVEGKHLVLFTDLPPSKETDELPELFDQMIPALCRFFGLNPKNYDPFRAEGFLIDDMEKFRQGGAVQQVPKLRNGYALRQRLWMRNPDSAYYRRHLLLHEGIHLGMEYAFGDWGPPWYREGTAEFLATHLWEDGKLELGYFPKAANELPLWGRIEMLQNALRNNEGKTLDGVFALSAEDYNENEAYSWSWAFAVFCEHHPSYRDAYRKTALNLDGKAKNVADKFLALVAEESKEHRQSGELEIRNRLENEWADFVKNVEYGYDFQRTAIVFRPAFDPNSVHPDGIISVAADRGWQDSGITLERGKTYKMTASGRFQLGNKPAPWVCEPNGITVRYRHSLPLGTLLAAQFPDAKERSEVKLGTPGVNAAFPRAVGYGTEWKAEVTGRIFFRINDFSSELEDNSGAATVRIVESPINTRH